MSLAAPTAPASLPRVETFNSTSFAAFSKLRLPQRTFRLLKKQLRRRLRERSPKMMTSCATAVVDAALDTVPLANSMHEILLFS